MPIPTPLVIAANTVSLLCQDFYSYPHLRIRTHARTHDPLHIYTKCIHTRARTHTHPPSFVFATCRRYVSKLTHPPFPFLRRLTAITGTTSGTTMLGKARQPQRYAPPLPVVALLAVVPPLGVCLPPPLPGLYGMWQCAPRSRLSAAVRTVVSNIGCQLIRTDQKCIVGIFALGLHPSRPVLID